MGCGSSDTFGFEQCCDDCASAAKPVPSKTQSAASAAVSDAELTSFMGAAVSIAVASGGAPFVLESGRFLATSSVKKTPFWQSSNDDEGQTYADGGGAGANGGDGYPPHVDPPQWPGGNGGGDDPGGGTGTDPGGGGKGAGTGIAFIKFYKADDDICKTSCGSSPVCPDGRLPTLLGCTLIQDKTGKVTLVCAWGCSDPPDTGGGFDPGEAETPGKL